MELKLHSNASTTPRTRKYIQSSDKTDSELANELSISIDTVKKWRNRDCFHDKSHRPKVIHKTLTPEQEVFILYLRKRLYLSLDELLEVTSLLINKGVSRSSLNRCLSSHKVGRLSKPKVEGNKNAIIIDAFTIPETIAHQSVLLIFVEKFSGHISFALIKKDDEPAKQKIARFLTNALPYKIESISSSSNQIAQDISVLILDEFEIHTGLELNSDTNFEQMMPDLLAGELFDRRLGLGATILEYEDILNKRVIRKRFKNLTPHAYITLTY